MDCIQVTKKGKKIVVVCVPRGVSTFSIKRVLLRSSKKCTSVMHVQNRCFACKIKCFLTVSSRSSWLRKLSSHKLCIVLIFVSCHSLLSGCGLFIIMVSPKYSRSRSYFLMENLSSYQSSVLWAFNCQVLRLFWVSFPGLPWSHFTGRSEDSEMTSGYKIIFISFSIARRCLVCFCFPHVAKEKGDVYIPANF